MKRFFIFLLALTVLCLPACQTGGNTPSDTDPIAQATEPSTEPQQTTEPQESTEPQPSTSSPPSYEWGPGHLWPFVYQDGNYFAGGDTLDDSEFEEGHLYAYNQETAVVAHVDGPVRNYSPTPDHIFFNLEESPFQIYRADYLGQGKELIVDLGSFPEINGAEHIRFQFYGLNPMGNLLVLVDQQRLYTYSMEDQSLTFLFEDHITSIFYLHYNRVLWSSKTPDGKPIDYIYHIETGENYHQVQ